jgi:copper chaperone CopZ
MDENCHVEPLQKTPTVEEQRTTTSALLAVWGMGCPNCGARVRNSLLSLTGVIDARVVLESGMADITYNPDLTDVAALINAVAQAGADGRHRYHAQVWNQQAAPLIL